MAHHETVLQAVTGPADQRCDDFLEGSESLENSTFVFISCLVKFVEKSPTMDIKLLRLSEVSNKGLIVQPDHP